MRRCSATLVIQNPLALTVYFCSFLVSEFCLVHLVYCARLDWLLEIPTLKLVNLCSLSNSAPCTWQAPIDFFMYGQEGETKYGILFLGGHHCQSSNEHVCLIQYWQYRLIQTDTNTDSDIYINYTIQYYSQYIIYILESYNVIYHIIYNICYIKLHYISAEYNNCLDPKYCMNVR